MGDKDEFVSYSFSSSSGTFEIKIPETWNWSGTWVTADPSNYGMPIFNAEIANYPGQQMEEVKDED